MDNNVNIYVLSTVFFGVETVEDLLRELNIKGIIGLNNNNINKDTVSGYVNMKAYCEKKNIDFIGVDSYNLLDDNDKKTLWDINIDILLVLGWQRLIPEWIINKVKIACIGSHGSPWGIEKGRGRSPVNWSLILGKDKFVIDIFEINKQIDSGDIIDEQEFIINEFDDVNSIYYKISWCVSQMIIKNIKSGNIFNKNYKKQNICEVRYLPKRTPEDGEIDWNRTNIEIYNFIRALTKPYPGAFSYLNNKKVLIWRTIPFNNMVGFEKYEFGEIIKYYSTQDEFLVKCKDGAILVKDYTSDNKFNNSLENEKFFTVNFNEQIKKILTKHYSVYNNNCNEEIEKYMLLDI